MMPMTTHNLLFNRNRRKGIAPLGGRNIRLVREHLAGRNITLVRVLLLPQ